MLRSENSTKEWMENSWEVSGSLRQRMKDRMSKSSNCIIKGRKLSDKSQNSLNFVGSGGYKVNVVGGTNQDHRNLGCRGVDGSQRLGLAYCLRSNERGCEVN